MKTQLQSAVVDSLCQYGMEVICTHTLSLLCSRTEDRLTYRDCVRRIYQQDGIRGFYKGLSASYYGVSETVLHLVVYEAVKAHLTHPNITSASGKDSQSGSKDMQTVDFFKFMLAGAISKSFATCLAYPHGECLGFFLSLSVFVIPLIHMYT